MKKTNDNPTTPVAVNWKQIAPLLRDAGSRGDVVNALQNALMGGSLIEKDAKIVQKRFGNNILAT